MNGKRLKNKSDRQTSKQIMKDTLVRTSYKTILKLETVTMRTCGQWSVVALSSFLR